MEMLKVNVLFLRNSHLQPPTQVIMTNDSLPESPKQIDVGGFALAVAGTPQSQPCTEKVLSPCLVPLLIPGLHEFIFPSFPKLPPSASLVSPPSIIHPDFLDPLSSRLLLVPWLLLLPLHSSLLTKHRPLRAKSDHVTPFLKAFNAFPPYCQ